MSDEDDTLRQTKRRIQTSDDRALQHRPAKSSPGIPMPEIDDPADTTSPFDLFKPERMERHRRRGDSVVALAQRLREERPDPYDLLAQLAFEHIDAKEKDRSANSELEKQFKAFLAQQPGGVEFENIKRTIGLWKWVGGAILTFALGSAGLGVAALWSRAVYEGETRAVIERLKSDVQQLLSGGYAPRNQPKDPQP